MTFVWVCVSTWVSLFVWMVVCLWVCVGWFSALLINRPAIALGCTVIIKTPTPLFHLKIISFVKWSKILVPYWTTFIGSSGSWGNHLFSFAYCKQLAIISKSYYALDITRDISCVFSFICIDLHVLSLSIYTQEHLRKLEGLGSGYIGRRWLTSEHDLLYCLSIKHLRWLEKCYILLFV